jgi:alpha-N-arabinofuranosidase
LSSSSSLKGNTLTVTVTNPSVDTSRTAEIAVRGGRIQNISAAMLAAKDVHAHNSFDNPRAVEPSALILKAAGSVTQNIFPPVSITKIEMILG